MTLFKSTKLLNTIDFLTVTDIYFTFHEVVYTHYCKWKTRQFSTVVQVLSVEPGSYMALERYAWITVTFRCSAVQQVTEDWLLSGSF